jgi:hypothetical protein
MDGAVERGANHVDGRGVMETTSGGNFQFRNTRVDDAGNQRSEMARFDVNPNDPHVQTDGAHLNLETHRVVDGKIEKTNDHIPINPNTVRPGDFPKK